MRLNMTDTDAKDFDEFVARNWGEESVYRMEKERIEKERIEKERKELEKLEQEFNNKFENDSNHKDDPKFTKLHFAATIDDVKIGELLISRGEDINAKDSNN